MINKKKHNKKIYIWGLNEKKYNPGYTPSPEIEERLMRLKNEMKKRCET